MINTKRGRITYRLRDISRLEVENRHFRRQYPDCRPLEEERPAIST